MDIQRPLRAVFDDLAGGGVASDRDVAELLRESGHGDLPEDLLGDALTSYADTAAVEVAAQLAPFVTAHTAGLGPDALEGLELLTGAAADLDAEQLTAAAAEAAAAESTEPGLDIDFGVGASVDELDLDALPEPHFVDEVPGEPAAAAPHFGDEVPGEGELDQDFDVFGEGAGVADEPHFVDEVRNEGPAE